MSLSPLRVIQECACVHQIWDVNASRTLYFLWMCSISETSSNSVTGILSSSGQSSWQESLSPMQMWKYCVSWWWKMNIACIITALLSCDSYKILHYSYKVNQQFLTFPDGTQISRNVAFFLYYFQEQWKSKLDKSAFVTAKLYWGE